MIEKGGYSQAEITKYINEVRDRVGMPAVEEVEGTNLEQDELRAIVRHERRVELAFEGHRLFDIRRWRIAEQVMNGEVYGATPPGADDRYLAQTRVFNPNRDYLWPIPADQRVLTGGLLTQNPGWTDSTDFD